MAKLDKFSGLRNEAEAVLKKAFNYPAPTQNIGIDKNDEDIVLAIISSAKALDYRYRSGKPSTASLLNTT